MRSTSFKFEAIGTHWKIDIPLYTSDSIRNRLEKDIVNLIEDFDKTYSRFREDSFVLKMAKRKGMYKLPKNAKPMMDLYKDIYEITDGAFTPLIASILEEAGYDRRYTFLPKEVHPIDSWSEVLDYSYPNLTFKKQALLDFGAGGKGYLIDLVSDVLKKADLQFFCVEAGGDMYYHSKEKNKLRVGLENPDNITQIIGVSGIQNESICASAGNRRRWIRYHHIINPHTLSSPEKIKATWVIAKTALLADSLATSLFFVDSKKLLRKYKFSYLVIKADNSIDSSKNFPAKLFKSK